MAIELIPMEEGEYQPFAERVIAAYADGKIIAGEYDPDEARELASAEFHRLLPEGLATEKNHLLMVTSAEDLRVGELWFAERQMGKQKIAMILHLYIKETERRHGYAKQSLLAVELLARQYHCEELCLHVFGHNIAARKLYENLGYSVVSMNMAKPL